MTTRRTRYVFAALISLMTAGPSVRAVGAQEYQNLKVLPADISRSDLTDIMLDNLRGLGLRRLAGEGCLFCHVGDLETPRREWDYASDAKPMKQKARVMLAMVRAINNEHLPQLASRIDDSSRVTCMTCHAGRTDPRPLPTVLSGAYDAGGIDSAAGQYRALRRRYFGRGAYDFRIGVVTEVALRMADRGSIDDAIALAAAVAEVNPDAVDAQRAWVQLRIERIIDASGVESALRELESIRGDLPRGVYSPDLLGDLAWRLRRSGRENQGVALLEANYQRFPNEYIPLESMAFVWAESGDIERAFEILERWLQEHPNHDRARRLLINLRRRG